MSKTFEETKTAAIELITDWHEENISRQALVEGLTTQPITVGYQPADEDGTPSGEREIGLWDELVDFASRGVLPTDVLEQVTVEGEFEHLNPELQEIKDHPVFQEQAYFSIFAKLPWKIRFSRKIRSLTFRSLFTKRFWQGSYGFFNGLGITVATLMALGCVILVTYLFITLANGGLR